MVHQFNKSLDVGCRGEKIVEEYFNQNDKILKWKKVTANRIYQLLDTDYVVTFKSGREATVEVKTSTYTDDKYIFFETVSDMLNNTPGCMYQSTADYIFYYFINIDKCYILPRKELVDLFELLNGIKHFKRRIVKNRSKDGGLYKTEGYLVPTDLITQVLSPLCTAIPLRSDI